MSIVSQTLQELYERGPESADALEALCQHSAAEGLNEPEFNMVLDVVFDHNLKSAYRHTLISKCLIPQAHYFLPHDTIYRIIGCIGIPQVYFKNERQLKLKRLPPATQQLLLLWLVSTLHLFGSAVYNTLGRLLPTLFGLLSYEYVRPHLVSLIVVGLSRYRLGKKSATGSSMPRVKEWHFSLVVDLARKFPFDSSLRFLLGYMNTLQPGKAPKDATASFSAKNPPVILPDHQITALADTFPRNESHHVKSSIQALFDSFSSSAAKRRKLLQPTPLSNLEVLEMSSNHDVFPIASVESLTTLVNEFHRISMINAGALFTVSSPNDKLRRIFVCLKMLSSPESDPVNKKFIHAAVHRPLSPAASSITMPQLLEFALLGRLPKLQRLVEEAIAQGKLAPAYQIRLLHLIDATPHVINRIWERVTDANDPALFKLFMDTVCCVLLRAYFLKATHELSLSFFPTVLTLTPKVFMHFLRTWPEIPLSQKFLLLNFLALLKQINPAQLVGDLTWIFPPPSMLYQMVVSIHPYIASEAYGFLAYLKTIKLKEDLNQALLNLRNTYVMDSINFVWRDMAFKSEESSYNKGMYLDPEYVKTLAGLGFFTYSELIELKSVGSLSHSPAFAYLSAQALWELEDQHGGVSKRHPGPLSEESITRLQQDGDVSWLPMSYFEIKVSILNKLDAMEFSGLCDLLFSSLRPLHGHRVQKRQLRPGITQ